MLRPGRRAPESRKRWDELHAANSFSAHEEIACPRWLVLEDRGETLWNDGKVDEAVKCWTLATRWFKALKFTSDATPRRPGRPTGEDCRR